MAQRLGKRRKRMDSKNPRDFGAEIDRRFESNVADAAPSLERLGQRFDDEGLNEDFNTTFTPAEAGANLALGTSASASQPNLGSQLSDFGIEGLTAPRAGRGVTLPGRAPESVASAQEFLGSQRSPALPTGTNAVFSSDQERQAAADRVRAHNSGGTPFASKAAGSEGLGVKRTSGLTLGANESISGGAGPSLDQEILGSLSGRERLNFQFQTSSKNTRDQRLADKTRGEFTKARSEEDATRRGDEQFEQEAFDRRSELDEKKDFAEFGAGLREDAAVAASDRGIEATERAVEERKKAAGVAFGRQMEQMEAAGQKIMIDDGEGNQVINPVILEQNRIETAKRLEQAKDDIERSMILKEHDANIKLQERMATQRISGLNESGETVTRTEPRLDAGGNPIPAAPIERPDVSSLGERPRDLDLDGDISKDEEKYSRLKRLKGLKKGDLFQGRPVGEIQIDGAKKEFAELEARLFPRP